MQKEMLVWLEQLTLGFCCLFSDPVDELNVSQLLQPLLVLPSLHPICIQRAKTLKSKL